MEWKRESGVSKSEGYEECWRRKKVGRRSRVGDINKLIEKGCY